MKTFEPKTSEIRNNSEVIFSREEAETLYQYAALGKVSCGILHDIINPISGLLLFLEGQGFLHTKEFTDPISESGKAIRNFISKVSKSIENPNHREIINLQNHISEIIELLRPKALVRKANINFLRNYAPTLIISNSLHIYQIFINLITNALDSFETTHPGQKNKIGISLEENSLGLTIKISDNGCGIENNNLEKIFHHAFSTKNSTGIGLAHTKILIEKELLGSVSVKSRPGIGTTFEIFLPSEIIINHSTIEHR